MTLGVNIDHVATLRQARYAADINARNAEPDLLAAASLCEAAGANGITVHLRADRRHIQDADVFRLRERVKTKLNLEIGNTPEILAIALRVKPDEVCLVPESRAEITTESGLNAAAQMESLRPTIATLREAGIRVSLFIDPSSEQIAASHALGADIVELHTGAFANAFGVDLNIELERLQNASKSAHALGLQVNAGHGINYANILFLRRMIPHLAELNIGHSIISRALSVGLTSAVREMLAAMRE